MISRLVILAALVGGAAAQHDDTEFGGLYVDESTGDFHIR